MDLVTKVVYQKVHYLYVLVRNIDKRNYAGNDFPITDYDVNFNFFNHVKVRLVHVGAIQDKNDIMD